MLNIIEKATGKVIGEVMTNRSMTIEAACDLAGIKVMATEEDFCNGEGYAIEDLDLEYV